QAEVKELRDRLNTDSHNSSKPPSSDGLTKKPVSLRQKTGRKPGGQHGHPGKTLSFVPDPDTIVPHSPQQCACCGVLLSETEGKGIGCRAVYGLPPPRLSVAEA